MRKFILIVTLLLACWLVAGLAEAEEVSIQEVCASWVSFICDTPVETDEITYIGENSGHWWFYSPLNQDCLFTGPDSNVWRIPNTIKID